MRVIAKALLASALLTLASPSIAAGGWTAQVVPTEVEIAQTAGFLIYGDFGSSGPITCNRSNAIWIAKSHPDYAALLSTALTAVAGEMKVRAYVHSCTMVGWIGSTFNELSAGGALRISR